MRVDNTSNKVTYPLRLPKVLFLSVLHPRQKRSAQMYRFRISDGSASDKAAPAARLQCMRPSGVSSSASSFSSKTELVWIARQRTEATLGRVSGSDCISARTSLAPHRSCAISSVAESCANGLRTSLRFETARPVNFLLHTVSGSSMSDGHGHAHSRKENRATW